MESRNSQEINLLECYRPWNLTEYRQPQYIRILRRFRVIKKVIKPDSQLSREILEAMAAYDWSHLKDLIVNHINSNEKLKIYKIH